MLIICFLQVWAASGEQKENFGGRREFTPLKWVMQEDIPQIPPMKKSVQVGLVMDCVPWTILKF